MSEEMSLGKKTAFILFGLLFALLLLEGVSALLLATVIREEAVAGKAGSQLVAKFPAQLRLDSEALRKEFPRELPLARMGNYMTLEYDPAMGFRLDGSLSWFGGDIDRLQDKFLILTFGGSTTVGDNWPKYLRPEAARNGVAEDIVVLNAGLWGYMTFNEKIQFTSWILPMLQKADARPDLVLTLDGVNDVWTRIMSYYLSQRLDVPWLDQYHGYHQQLSTEMKRMASPSHAFFQFVANAGRAGYGLLVDYGALVIPYTLKMMLTVSKKILQGNQNLAEAVDRAARDVRQLDMESEGRIIRAMKGNLLDFFGMARARNIPFAAYLQPVLLKKYYPHPVPDHFYFPDFDHEAMNLHRENRFFSILTGNYVVRTERLYSGLESMYHTLNQQHPGHFKSLAGLFHDDPRAGELYAKDAVHYGDKGKRTIARAIVADLLEKGILTRR